MLSRIRYWLAQNSSSNRGSSELGQALLARGAHGSSDEMGPLKPQKVSSQAKAAAERGSSSSSSPMRARPTVIPDALLDEFLDKTLTYVEESGELIIEARWAREKFEQLCRSGSAEDAMRAAAMRVQESKSQQVERVVLPDGAVLEADLYPKRG